MVLLDPHTSCLTVKETPRSTRSDLPLSLLSVSGLMFRTVTLAARTLAPLGDRILIRRAAKEVQTAGGIYLPTDTTKDPNEGEVVAVGPGERDVTGNLHVPSLQSGDSVLLPEYGGTKVKIDDEELFLFRESDILGKFD